MTRPTPPGPLLSSGSHRTAWADLPAEVRQWAEGQLGGPVTDAVTASGGFSPVRCAGFGQRLVAVRSSKRSPQG